MIGITGYMSGGKSYTSVRFMLAYLKQGQIVVTNIRLNIPAVTKYLDIPCVLWMQQYYLLTDTLSDQYHHIFQGDYNSYPVGSPRGSQNPLKVYIFLDEVSSIFDSMIHTSDAGIQAVATWARHSEKRGQLLYLIMQFSSELHKRLRIHITEYIHCTNTSNLTIPLVGCHLPKFLHNLIILQHVLADGETVIGHSEWFSLNPSIYKCYNTSQIVVGHHTSADIIPHFVRPNPQISIRKGFLQCLIIQLLFCVALFVLWSFLGS